MPAIVELTIRRLQDSSLIAELRVELPRGRANLGSTPISISVEALRGLRLLPDAYGAALTVMALPQALHLAWQRARGYTEGSDQGLHVRVALDDPISELDTLRWELLRDPLTNTPLAQQEGGSLARLVILDDLHERALPARPELRAFVAVAGPVDAEQWELDSVDVAGEAARARQALGEMQADVLDDTAPGSVGLATLDNLRDGLRGGPHVLYLICHGKATEAGTILYLVGDDGRAAPITAETLATEVAALDPGHRPLLAVLVACEGASQDKAPLASIGLLLARGGTPAVVAMQASISMDAATNFTGRLLRELRRDGRIDGAVAAARKEMGSEWWVPVLWLRSRDGRLWAKEGFTTDEVTALLTKVQSQTIPLSQCIAEVLGLARKLGNTDLEAFCKRELEGTPYNPAIDPKTISHRLVRAYISPGQVGNAHLYPDIDTLLEAIAASAHFAKVWMPFLEPISQVEHRKNTIRGEQLIVITRNMGDVIPDAITSKVPIYTYLHSNSYDQIIEATRAAVTKRLLAL